MDINHETASALFDEIIADAEKFNYCCDKKTHNFKNEFNQSQDFEIFLFANFDICNFTKYKREHKDWLDLLKSYLSSIKEPIPDWAVTRFWKFNGDSLTFRRKIESVYEICSFIKQVQTHLEKLQELLWKENTEKKVYIKAAVWIAGFPEYKSVSDKNKFNNQRIKVDTKEEFVGISIDEGFRLSSCSKANKLVVDPKIVGILYLYNIIINEATQSSEFTNPYSDEITSMLLYIFNLKEKDKDNFLKLSEFFDSNIRYNICKNLFLMEYKECKGVWDDRDYPIFWYIEDLKKCDLIYDEIVNNKKLREHELYKIVTEPKCLDEKIDELYIKYKNELFNVFAQVNITTSLKELLFHLSPYPKGPSEEKIYDKANLYYMTACVLKQEGIDLGILVFKRTDKRVHLKNVWELIPIKHGKVYNSQENYSVLEYIKTILINRLWNENNQTHNFDFPKSLKIEADVLRDSIKPYSFCNIYRHNEVHNGILCVAEIDITGIDTQEFIGWIKSDIDKNQYSDVKLINLENIKEEIIDDKNSYFISVDGIEIRSIHPKDVRLDALKVYEDSKYISFKPKGKKEYGISFLADSIKEVHQKRNKS